MINILHIELEEANSVPEAIAQIKARIPKNFSVVSFQVLSDAQTKSITGTAETAEDAFVQLEFPKNASIIEKKVLTIPQRQVFTIEGYDEADALARLNSRVPGTPLVKGIRLVKVGRSFLFWKGVHTYEVDTTTQAVVTVTYRIKAKVRASVGDVKTFLKHILTENVTDEHKRTKIEASLLELGIIDHNKLLKYCTCGYPIGTETDYYSRGRSPGNVILFGESVLDLEFLKTDDFWTNYNCPNCGRRVGDSYMP